jgi:hypothetical protein
VEEGYRAATAAQVTVQVLVFVMLVFAHSVDDKVAFEVSLLCMKDFTKLTLESWL